MFYHYPVFFQWFNFSLQGTIGEHYVLNIENAGAAKYPKWNLHRPYQTYASYDKNDWFSVNAVFNEQTGVLTMELDLTQEQVHFAYFPPYSYARHLDLIEKATTIPHCKITHLGKTNGEDGRDISLLTFGTPTSNKKKIWFIARQHPGEPQAEWYAEGLIDYLAENPQLLEQYTFHIVPNMNPDGTYDGNLRTNKEGIDLNRMWLEPTLEKSPEVYYVLNAMRQIGVDLFIDAHGDETIPFPFLDLAHLSSADITETLEKQEEDFMTLYIELSSSMQNELNYGKTNRTDYLTLASVKIGSEFGCPSFTLEMPAKGWSWQQCKLLAKEFFSVLEAFYTKVLTQTELPNERNVPQRSPHCH